MVKELAFGCLGETSSKVSLWFDLPEPVHLTNQEIKRHKRNRQRKLVESSGRYPKLKSSPFPGASNDNESTTLSFEKHTLRPFFHMRTYGNNPVAFRLICSTLKHRISVLLRRKYSHVHDMMHVRESLLKEEERLQCLFRNLVKDMNEWKWSVSKGREKVLPETDVPRCSAEYEPSKESIASCLWEGFVKSTSSPSSQNVDPKCSRLRIFKNLSKGRSHKGVVDDRLIQLKSQGEKNINNNAWETIFGDESSGGWNLIKGYYLLDANETKKDKSMPLSPSHGEK